MKKTIRRLMYYEVQRRKINGRIFVSNLFHTIYWQMWDERSKRYKTVDKIIAADAVKKGWKIVEVKRERKE